MERSPLDLLPPFREDAFVYYRRLRRVREGVCTDPMTPLSRDQAADLACISPSHFSVFFSLKVGIPYSKWINVIRLRVAITLMMEANYSVLELADRSGFTDTRAFQRAAKALTRRTPTELKEAGRGFQSSAARTEQRVGIPGHPGMAACD